MEFDNNGNATICRLYRKSISQKYLALGYVAFGLEPSLVITYQTYWLTNERDALNCSAVCVNQDNRTHTDYPQTQFSSHYCVHFGPEQPSIS